MYGWASYVRLGEPGSLEGLWIHRGTHVNTGGSDDVTAPGVIGCVRQVPRFAYIPEATHRKEPPDARELHTEAID